MKKNKLLLIVILVILAVLYVILRLGRPEEKLRPVFGLDSLAVKSIEIFDAADSLKLEKEKGVWFLTQPVHWQADTLKVNPLSQKVLTAKYPLTPMGTGSEAIKRFSLQDKEALHMVVSGNGKRIHVLFSNLGNPYDYFRFAGSDQIYQIKAKVVNTFTTDLPMWRSPHVVSYYEDELLKINITRQNNTATFTRKDFDWFYQDKRLNFQIPRNNIAMTKLVNILSNLDTYVFVDKAKPELLEKFKTPEITVQLILTENRTQELKFTKYDSTQYMMMVDNDPNVLFIVSTDTVYRFNRSGDVFKIKGYGI